MKVWHFAALVALGWWAAGCAPRVIEKTCRPAKQVPYASGQLCSCKDVKTGRYVKCPPLPPSP